jgi:hypothetical protein
MLKKHFFRSEQMKAQTKKSKMIAFFRANPNAKPKDAAAKFKVAMPTIYAIRKQALAGDDWKTAAVVTSNTPVAVDEVAVLDQDAANLVYQASLGRRQRMQSSTTANSQQYGGDHYISMGVQPWKAMEAWMSREAFMGFLRGNAIKYLARTDKKGGVEDMKKARHYLDKLIETAEIEE